MSTRLHGKREESGRGWVAPAVAAGLAVALVLAGAVTVLALHHNAVPAGSHTLVAPQKGPKSSGGSKAHGGTRATPVVPPLEIESVSPAPGASDLSYTPTFTVRLSQPVATGSAMPTLSPSLPGSWTASGPRTLVFQASAQVAPYTSIRLTVPGGPGGVRDTAGSGLPRTLLADYAVEGASTLRLQQLLAELGYLPLTFVPATDTATVTVVGGSGQRPTHVTLAADTSTKTKSAPTEEPVVDSEPTVTDQIPLAPLAGHFVWRFANTPGALEALWSPGVSNVVTRGAVMAFEAAQGLGVDGDAGPMVWRTLLAAVAGRHLDPAPYDYISVSEGSPETLSVWQDGRTLFSVLANTGISVAPTAQGTWPVYVRYLVTTMSGKNPDGSKYKDPGIPHVAYFNGGDAIHGFLRPGYGYPQSLGCVELTYADAAQVWPYDQLGTLVTVS